MSDGPLQPEVRDDSGKPLVGPDLDAVLKRVAEMAQVAQLARIRKAIEQGQANQVKELGSIRRSLKRQEFQGITEELTLSCTSQVSWVGIDIGNVRLQAPWITVSFVNDGPNDAFISVNRQSYPFTIKIHDVYPIDFSRADQRLEEIYYYCAAGETASVRAVGKY